MFPSHDHKAHDSIADEQGIAQAGVDILREMVHTLKYDSGGVDINDVIIDDNSSSFTNGAVVSSKPVSDNIGYSLG